MNDRYRHRLIFIVIPNRLINALKILLVTVNNNRQHPLNCGKIPIKYKIEIMHFINNIFSNVSSVPSVTICDNYYYVLQISDLSYPILIQLRFIDSMAINTIPKLKQK